MMRTKTGQKRKKTGVSTWRVAGRSLSPWWSVDLVSEIDGSGIVDPPHTLLLLQGISPTGCWRGWF